MTTLHSIERPAVADAVLPSQAPGTPTPDAPGAAPLESADEYSRLIAERRFQAALALVDTLLGRAPNEAELYLKRVECLERLGRNDEIPAAIGRALRLRPGWEAAVFKRVEHANALLNTLAPLPRGIPEAPPPELRRRLPVQLRHALKKRAQTRHLIAEFNRRDLSQLIVTDPSNAHACFLLAEVLRLSARADHPNAHADRLEAAQWLDRAIRFAPERNEYRERRATLARHDKIRLK